MQSKGVTEPRCSRKEDGSIHINHEFSDRISVAKVYPVRSPNGSTIIVTGHEKGLTIIWRGGRGFTDRPTYAGVQKQPSRLRSNGSRSDTDRDVVMGVDGRSDMDDFEVLDDITRGSTPVSPVIATLDIPLDSSVLHIAFPPIASGVKPQARSDNYSNPDFPQIFTQDLVISATCSNSSTHLVTTSLTPTRPRSSGRATDADHSYQDITLSLPQDGSSLRKIPTAVSMTWTLDIVNSPPTEQHSPTRGTKTPNKTTWTLLIATTTSEGTGLLKIHAISVLCKRSGSEVLASSSRLLQIEQLPALPKTISFRPTPHPSSSHTQLFIVDVQGTARFYDPLHGSHLHSGKVVLGGPTGQWIMSLYAPFEHVRVNQEAESLSEPRAKVLDATWAMSGTCVIVLLSDGSWGVWEIEGLGANPQGGGLRRSSALNGSITGAGITPFALRGSIGRRPTSSQEAMAQDFATSTEREPKKLAPMTPKTRKAKQEHLFTQRASRLLTVPGIAHGGISSTACWMNDNALDDSLLFWYDAEIFHIPSLRSYWRNAANRSLVKTVGRSESAPTGTPYGAVVRPVPYFTAGGEAITCVSQYIHPMAIGIESFDTQPNDIVVSAEHRICIIQPPQIHKSQRAEDELSKLFAPLAGSESRPNRLDQDLLARGELDVGGLDRLMNVMGESQTISTDDVFGAPSSRRVGFASS